MLPSKIADLGSALSTMRTGQEVNSSDRFHDVLSDFTANTEPSFRESLNFLQFSGTEQMAVLAWTSLTFGYSSTTPVRADCVNCVTSLTRKHRKYHAKFATPFTSRQKFLFEIKSTKFAGYTLKNWTIFDTQLLY